MTQTPSRLTPPPDGSALLRENVEDASTADAGELLKRREPTMMLKGRQLIPPATHLARKYTVVFDLDETVVYARNGPLYARAYLKDLFRAIKDDFEVIVWTAGVREYAKTVLEEINEDHIVKHLVYRHEKWFNEDDYTKNLRQLGRDLDYTIMIENTPDCVRANPQNSIIVEDFEVLPASLTTTGFTDDGATRPPTPLPEADGIIADNNSSATSSSTIDGDTSSMPMSSSQPRQRRTKDRTLFLLREVLLALVESGETVPQFLSTCELLTQQTVVGCNGGDISIYHLGTRRRRKDAGIRRKEVKVNRDRVMPNPAPAGATAEAGKMGEIEVEDELEVDNAPPRKAARRDPAVPDASQEL